MLSVAVLNARAVTTSGRVCLVGYVFNSHLRFNTTVITYRDLYCEAGFHLTLKASGPTLAFLRQHIETDCTLTPMAYLKSIQPPASPRP